MLNFIKERIKDLIRTKIFVLNYQQRKSIKAYKDYSFFNRWYMSRLLQEPLTRSQILSILYITKNIFLLLAYRRYTSIKLNTYVVIVYLLLTDELLIIHKFQFILNLCWIVYFYVINFALLFYWITTKITIFTFISAVDPILGFIVVIAFKQIFIPTISLISSLLFLLLNFISKKHNNKFITASKFLVWFYLSSTWYFKKQEHRCSLDETAGKKYSKLALHYLKINE